MTQIKSMETPTTFSEINDATGFANGARFDSDDEVRQYFTRAAQLGMFGECPYTQDELDEMADRVIDGRWNYAGATPDAQ